jgi:hypothetical protein
MIKITESMWNLYIKKRHETRFDGYFFNRTWKNQQQLIAHVMCRHLGTWEFHSSSREKIVYSHLKDTYSDSVANFYLVEQ